MSCTIEVPEELHHRLQALAGQLFTIPEVLERLVNGVAGHSGSDGPGADSARSRPGLAQSRLGRVNMRTARERGATVEVNGQRIHAGTVANLYAQVFRILVGNGLGEKLELFVPYSTSSQRYLIAREPKHPNGKDFFVPIQVGPYYIETHKNYETALRQLAELLAKLDLEFTYLG